MFLVYFVIYKIITPTHVKRSTLLILYINHMFESVYWEKALSGEAHDLHALDYERRKDLV